MKLIKDPPKKGEMDRGWLGISLQALTTEMAHFWKIDAPGGIIVNDIVNNSPAYQGGLKVGDIVIGLNGSPIPVDKEESLPVFQRRIAEMGPGSKVDLLVLRNEDENTDTLNIDVTLAPAPKAPSDAEDYESEMLEMKVRNMVFSDYLRNKLDSATFEGVVVSEIKSGGLADIGGLQIGDIIQRVEGTDIRKVGDFKAALESLEQSSPREVIFFVWRNNKTLFINVKTDWN
jgi:serine protease Do